MLRFTFLNYAYTGCMLRIPYVARIMDLSIDELNLSVRSSNRLMQAGLHTFGKLYGALTQEGGIFKVRNLGAKSEREIRIDFVEECNLQMPPYEKVEFWQTILDSLK